MAGTVAEDELRVIERNQIAVISKASRRDKLRRNISPVLVAIESCCKGIVNPGWAVDPLRYQGEFHLR